MEFVCELVQAVMLVRLPGPHNPRAVTRSSTNVRASANLRHRDPARQWRYNSPVIFGRLVAHSLLHWNGGDS